MGNDQALEVYYINHDEQKIVQLNIDRFKQLSFAPNLKYKKSIPLQNEAETWLLERGDFFTWRQDNLNYSIAGNLTEEEFVAIANSLKNP